VHGKIYKKKSYSKLSQNINIAGFRKGKAPEHIVKQHLSDQKILIEAVENVINKIYYEAIEKEKLMPIIKPSTNIKTLTKEETEIEFIVTLFPEISLGEYKNLKIQKAEASISDTDIERELDLIKQKYADLRLKSDDAVIEENDIVIADLECEIINHPKDNFKMQNQTISINKKETRPEFVDKLLGLKANDQTSIDFECPANFGAHLVGEMAKYIFNIKEVKEKVLPDLDEELIKELNIENVTNLEELKIYISKSMLEYNKI